MVTRPTLALLLLTLSATAALGAEEQCATCHPESRVAFAKSIHAREELSCTSCHGGDAETQVVERAHRGSFNSLKDRVDVPPTCARCHSDLTNMRAYNLPVDQFAIYQTSQHGLAIARGDRRAAVCSDCHGTHGILAVDDPSSSVHPQRILSTCADCHADQALMASYGLSSAVVGDYRGSIHGRSLLEAGNAAAPNCTSCHGTHGPTPPGVGDIDKVCGACHAQTRRAFLAGPHRDGMLSAGQPECASCHSNHAIRSFGLAEIESLCADCHGQSSGEVALGRKLHTLIEGAGAEVDRAEEMALEGERLFLHVEDHFSRIEEARTYLTEALTLVHTVDLESVDQMTRRARSIGEEVQHEIYEKLNRRPAHIGLAVFWFYMVMTLAVLFQFKRKFGRPGPERE